MSGHSEREFSPADALEQIYHEIYARNWKFKTRATPGPWPTVFSEILTHRGQPIQDGLGKGQGIQAELSGLFEAFEHAVFDLSLDISKPSWRGSLDEAQSRFGWQIVPKLLEPSVVEPLQNLTGQWRIMRSLHDQHTALLPLCFASPFSDYAELYPNDQFASSLRAPYISSNNGCAIGVTHAEARLHALNEIVERYALSSIYASAYIAAQPLRLVDRTTCPLGLRRMCERIETQHNCQIKMFDITTELGVPCFLGRAEREDLVFALRGSGSSLNPAYAAERAILEVLQLLDVHEHSHYGPINQADARTALSRLKAWPNLKAAAAFDLSSTRIQDVPFAKNQSAKSASVTAQAAQITKIFADEQIEIFEGVLYEGLAASIHAVQLIAPELSDFFYITHGLPVVPTGRVLQKLLALSA